MDGQVVGLPGVTMSQLGALAAFFHIGTAVLDADGKGHTLNAQWASLARLPSHESRREWMDTIHPGDREAARECVARAAVDGDSEIECRLNTGNGRAVWVHMRVFRMEGATTGRQYIVGISDISRFHEMRLRHVEKELQNIEDLRRSMLSTIESLGAMEAVRDLYTAGHQSRVGRVAVMIGEHFGLGEESCTGLRLAATLHDVGKVGIPLEILTKPAKLDHSEFSMMKTHSTKGYEILRNVRSMWPLARVAYEHHECLDGSGYPQGLKGGDILLESQIAAVADIVESMTAHRPYRPGLPMEMALETVRGMRGTKLNPDAVDVCVSLAESGKLRLPELD